MENKIDQKITVKDDESATEESKHSSSKIGLESCGKGVLFAYQQVSIDKKKRFAIPSKANFKVNDDVAITYANDNFLRIVAADRIYDQISHLEQLIKNCKDIEQFEELRRKIDCIYTFSKVCTLDKQRRILISKSYDEIFTFENKIIITGDYYGLKLFPNQELFEDHKRKILELKRHQ